MKHPQIPLTAVESSQIHAIGHDASTNSLAIQFKSKGGPGSVCHYANFTDEQYEQFSKAASIGAHFGKFIKPETEKHPYVNVAADTSENAECEA